MSKNKPRNNAIAIETRTCNTSLDENGVIRATMKPGAREALADAVANVAAARTLSGGIKRPLLCDYREIHSQSREAQIYYGSHEVAEVYSVCAIVVAKPLGTVIAKFYMGLRKPVTPTRLFTDPKAAYEWLHPGAQTQ